MVHIPAALQNPITATVARRPRSVRRTSHIDMAFGPDGGLELVGAARDLRTSEGGAPEQLAAAEVRALMGPSRRLERIEVEPGAAVDGLLGHVVGAGFRAVLDEQVPAERTARSPLYLLLDDLPVAALISGYIHVYLGAGQPMTQSGGEAPQRRGPPADICSGWRSEGVMMRAIREDGGIPSTVGPAAPDLDGGEDPWAWHLVPVLPAGAMRRRRLVDVAPGDGTLSVSAMFRDTHVDEAGIETVLHEYEVSLEVDPGTLEVVGSEATPRTLPWPECPAAAASAHRLVGHGVGDVRTLVRRDFRGTTTCTHLNDLFRSLADVDVLARSLP